MTEKILIGAYLSVLCLSLTTAYWLTFVNPERNRLTRFIFRVSSRRRLSVIPEPEGRTKIFWIAVSCSVTSLVVLGLLLAEAIG